MASRSTKKRQSYAKRANFTCEYCGGPATLNHDDGLQFGTIDHFWPKHLKGTSSKENAVWACLKCNAEKGPNLWPIERAPKRLQKIGWLKQKLSIAPAK
jgi:5-methylcytosine-specific restriction endonuclease McrA